ncbi:hypothetical protein EUTSA_v10026623mg [Eutrema salsugineum]|uniref:Uncharacterized protein n=1 Tax=Eutrema salsugineum TaxID=72664 RepID=V4P992_EUTSA|nr:hypothetical protein EUTSA_v10026623mg [Eutrema salsugineum]
MCPAVNQSFDDCWAVTFSRAISVFLKINGSTITPPTAMTLLTGVDDRHITRTGAIDLNVRPALQSDNDDKHEKYERCIVRLLAKAPLAVGFEYLPSARTHDWKVRNLC